MERRNFSVKDYDRANYFKYLAQQQEQQDHHDHNEEIMNKLEKEERKIRKRHVYAVDALLKRI